jgi:hypothetical protein
MSKRRVSFEVTYNWSILGFRNFIRALLSDEENYEVFIISNDNSTAYITAAGNVLNMEASNIIICNFANDKIQAIQDNNIDIHFDDLQSFILLVDETTDAHGILVTANMNKYENVPDYQVVFNRLLKQLDSEEKDC